MKKYLLIFCVTSFFFACDSDSNTTSNAEVSGDGQGGSLATFTLKGNYLYVVDSENLSVFNISETTNPAKINSVYIGFQIETLFPFNDYLFIGSQDAMYIYDLSNPEFPKQLSRSSHFRSCDPVVVNERYAYVTLHTNSSCFGTLNELQTYDIQDVENPKLLNVRELTEPKGLSTFGSNYLFVCDDTVKIFDVSNPEQSKFIKEIPTQGALDIIIRNNHAFIIADGSIEQYALNVADIKNFEKISTFTF